MRPLTTISPSLGGRMPAIARMMVDLPAPFAPMMPSTEPCGTSKDTPRTAWIIRTLRSLLLRRPRPVSVCRSVFARGLTIVR